MLPVVAGERGDAAADLALYAGPRGGRRCAVGARPDRRALRRRSRRRWARSSCAARCGRVATRATERRRDEAREGGCSTIRSLYLFVMFARARRRSRGARMNVDWTPEQTPSSSRRRRSRNSRIGLLLGCVRHPVLRDHHRADDQVTHGSSTRQPHAPRCWRGGLRRRDDRPRLRQRAALPRVLPGDRLRRHDAARRGRAGSAPVAGTHDLGALRRQRRARHAVGVPRPTQTQVTIPIGGRDMAFFPATNLSGARSPAARPSTSRPTRPANISRRSSASASPSRR